MIRLRTFALLVLAGLIGIPAGQSSAQVKYVDENGNSHWVQSENQVPERYQGKATKPSLPIVMQSDGRAERALDNNLQRLRSNAAADERRQADDAQRRQRAAFLIRCKRERVVASGRNLEDMARASLANRSISSARNHDHEVSPECRAIPAHELHDVPLQD